MTAAGDSATVGAMDDAFVRLAASVPLRADPDRVVSLIRAGAAAWLPGAAEHPSSPGLRNWEVDLRLPIGGHEARTVTFRKAAHLDLGLPRRTPGGWVAEIGWRASTAAPLFPVFSGWLTVGHDELRIEGLYAPPGGAVGRVADRILLHVAANGTARWLLREIDRAALGAAR